ncbi:MAG: hypothetical protein KC668_21250 [Myxococcales bacterium]|nr:hypothetical protein [Myxococcales bacterium]
MTPSQKRWFGAAALALAVPAGWAWIRLTSQRSDNLSEFHGARLGMSASELRRGFVYEGVYRVHSDGDADGELAVEWAPASTSSDEGVPPFSSVRFEFHQGLLVAIRADSADPGELRLAQSHPFVADAAAVLHRSVIEHSSASTARVRVTLLSRDCPTHADEVHQLMALGAHPPVTSSEEPPSSH